MVALLTGVIGAAGAVAPALAAAPVPRVVLIVGPVGSLTSSYRAIANDAAGEAQAAGAEVVKVYSPNATWSAVKQAVTGASIVVYLGHGNGWPSPYRNELYPPTQDGFGLNPVVGVDDVGHQYFGEASIQHLRLAANAVVLLSHLCYASGNSEPGLPEGTRDQAIARVDNFAAGFIRAGAQAVVAEAHAGPAYYVRQLLRTQLSIERIWSAAPSAHGNAFGVVSERSPGYTEQLDPDRASGGFNRSLVSRGVTASQVRSGATGTTSGVVTEPVVEPSLVDQGIRFGDLSLGALPIASTTTQLTLPVAGHGAKLIPAGAQVGIRWDPILLDPQPANSEDPGVAPAQPSSPDASASPAPPSSPDASASPSPGPGSLPSNPALQPDPATTPEPTSSSLPGVQPATPPEPPSVDLVAPEQLGNVVVVGKVTRSGKGLGMTVTYPSAPGLYRLVATLHAPSGVAYDVATQALLTPALVRVGGPVAVAYGAPASFAITAGVPAPVAVRVVNAGSESWDVDTDQPPDGTAEEILSWLRTSRSPAKLVATWVSTASQAVPDPVTTVLDPTIAAPGGSAMVTLELQAPTAPGNYLLLLDVISPAHGPLSALGSAPALIRVAVSGTGAVPGPSAAPEPSVAPGG